MSDIANKHNELKQKLEKIKDSQAETKARLSVAEESLRKTLEDIKALGVDPANLDAKLAELELEIKTEQQNIEQELSKIPALDTILNKGLVRTN